MDLIKEVNKYEQYVIDLYRDFHRHPEVGGKEERTMGIVEEELKKMGLEPYRVPNGCIVAKINAGKAGKKVALRADMDALPVPESKDNLKGPKTVVSEFDGVSHTCGHDAHTAMLLGSARILSENRDLVDGEVLLIFEQGEEMGAGIFGVAETIYTEKPDTLWGIHVKADFPSGKVSVEPGARMAAALGIKGKIIGRGGHGSRPDLAINPLNCFADIYQAFRNMKADYISPFSATTFSIGQVEYGTSGNIISDTLTFAGTVRFTDIEVGRAAASRMQKIVHDICELHGCKYELNKLTATDMRVYNNEVCSKIATEAITEVLGSDVHMHKDPWMASESMGIYMKYVPSVFEFLGIADEEKGMGADHHNPSFEIDESALKFGTASTVQYTLNFMKEKPEIDFVPPDLPPSELIKALFGL